MPRWSFSRPLPDRPRAGTYLPQFADRDERGDPVPVAVDAFRLDATPVTVEQYLAFLGEQPEWRRGRAPEVLAGAAYRWGMRSSLTGSDGCPLVGFRCAAGP